MNKATIFDALAASAGAVFGFLFGEITGLFYALIAVVALDYFTGVMVAIKSKELSSAEGFRGICKKIYIFVVVALAHLVDEHLIGGGSALMTAAMFFFFANEGISILENAGNMGLPVPEKLLSVLKQIKNKDKEK